MELIVTHDMADFDALASAVAAQKLHPGASIVLGHTVGPEVRRYLALHKDRFRTVRVGDVDLQGDIEHVIFVDVRRKSRLGEYAKLLGRPGLKTTVYDHHPAAADDIDADVEVVERVGSASTLLVEEMRRRGIGVDALEATLLSLGIHADTGSLSYAESTARDARALGYLLDRGASLSVIARYLRPAFSGEQRELLSRVLGEIRVESIGHLDIGFVSVELPHAIDGFGEVVSEAIALTVHVALFAAFGLEGRRTQLVARARLPAVDVGKVLAQLGGGGHASAASAVVRRGDAAMVLADVEAILRRDPPRPARVLELMSSPVHTVAADTPLADVSESLAAWRHTGVPVKKDGKLVGIISRRDVEKAERDGRLALPVSSCMSHQVKTTTPEQSLSEALAQMQSEDVGRLPVMRGDKLVGIITRTDVLRALYGGKD